MYLSKPLKRFLIISGYFEGESYGLLGPQMAATVIENYSDCRCIVIGVCREYHRESLKKNIYEWFKGQKPIVGFSTLLGREDLFFLAKELKEEGAVTILAGPQAEVDFMGEIGWRKHPNRFKGFWDCFDFAIKGPAEQIIPFLKRDKPVEDLPGTIFKKNGKIIKNLETKWDESFLSTVNWDNLYIFHNKELSKVHIDCVQILHQIGCPYAKKRKTVFIDYPTSINSHQKIKLEVMGCSFCDVAADKGFCGSLDVSTILKQINRLPEDNEKRKIPFEIINENPIPFLHKILELADNNQIRLSQINLTLRSDWMVNKAKILENVLKIAKDKGIKILISSVGFESFDDYILKNLNKGVNVDTNLHCIKIMRRIKEEFPLNFFYSRDDGAVHGFIHPTPWDNPVVAANIQKRIFVYNLFKDILPHNSTPLVIHHASSLGEWVRKLEIQEKINFPRKGNIIYWWDLHV